MAGGVALNCVANGRLLETGLFKNVWIQPAAGDAGGALGAALAAQSIPHKISVSAAASRGAIFVLEGASLETAKVGKVRV